MTLVARTERVISRLNAAQWIPQLLVRLFVGFFFFETGWGKVNNLPSFTQKFIEWGIPAPAFNAALSGWTEFLGGALIMAGLGTRLVSIPMVINMVVAILSTKLAKVGSLSDFVELDEPLYALSFLWLFFSGPGKVSLDHLLRKAIHDRSVPADRAAGRARPASATQGGR
jgi:putative oxidoreductase